MKKIALFVLFKFFALACPVAAQTVTMPASVSVAPGRLGAIKITYDGEDVRWEIPPELDAFREYSLDPKDVRLRVQGFTPGKFRLLAIACKGGKLSEFAACVVTIEGQAPVPPKPDPPIDPPLPPSGSLYFMLIRPDGPSHPDFTRIMSDPAWAALRSKGHSIKDFSLTAARGLGANIPTGTPLPCVVTLSVSPDGKKSVVVRGPISLPTTSDAILKLTEGVK